MFTDKDYKGDTESKKGYLNKQYCDFSKVFNLPLNYSVSILFFFWLDTELSQNERKEWNPVIKTIDMKLHLKIFETN